MKRITHHLLVLVAVLLGGFGVSASAGELMSPSTAARLGLEEVWTRQLKVPAGADSIVDMQVVTHVSEPHEYVEVVGKAAEGEEAPVYFRISTDHKDAAGQPIGKEEAERLARREVRRLARRNLDVSITSRSVPRIYLYTASNNGTIECRNAETGAPVWMTHVGDRGLTWGKMGIDDEFVTITNGGNLIKIDASNGEPINTVRMTSVPLYGALQSGDYTVVPTIRNGVECYYLRDTTEVPFMEIVAGLALKPPTKSPSSSRIAWGTDREFVYVMETSGEPSVLFRLNTDGIVSGRIAAGPGNRFYFGSESGQVYAIRGSLTGSVLWSQPYGEPFYKAPFLAEDKLLLTSAYGNLYALDIDTGLRIWDAPKANVDEILGAIGNVGFVRLSTGAFAALNLLDGSLLDRDSSMMPDHLMINRVSDRLYFVNKVGTVQCLRPIGHDTPTVRETEEAEADEQVPDSTQPMQPVPGGLDPFGKPADPFGAGGADPFGGDAGGMGGDPFGGDAPADPFAAPADGAADPFGGDPFGN